MPRPWPGGRTVVAAGASRPVSGGHRHYSLGRVPSQDGIAIHQEEITRLVGRNRKGFEQAGGGCQDIDRRSAPGKRRDVIGLAIGEPDGEQEQKSGSQSAHHSVLSITHA